MKACEKQLKKSKASIDSNQSFREGWREALKWALSEACYDRVEGEWIREELEID